MVQHAKKEQVFLITGGLLLLALVACAVLSAIRKYDLAAGRLHIPPGGNCARTPGLLWRWSGKPGGLLRWKRNIT